MKTNIKKKWYYLMLVIVIAMTSYLVISTPLHYATDLEMTYLMCCGGVVSLVALIMFKGKKPMGNRKQV